MDRNILMICSVIIIALSNTLNATFPTDVPEDEERPQFYVFRQESLEELLQEGLRRERQQRIEGECQEEPITHKEESSPIARRNLSAGTDGLNISRTHQKKRPQTKLKLVPTRPKFPRKERPSDQYTKEFLLEQASIKKKHKDAHQSSYTG